MLRERVHTSYIADLPSAGHNSRIGRGVYEWLDDGPKDDLEIIGRLIPESILCMESALHYHGYTDRTPGVWHIAVSKNIKTICSRSPSSLPEDQMVFSPACRYSVRYCAMGRDQRPFRGSLAPPQWQSSTAQYRHATFSHPFYG